MKESSGIEKADSTVKKARPPFDDFNDAVNDHLTIRDKEALKKIKKGEEGDLNSEGRFIKGNYSILGEIEDTSNFYKIKKEEGSDVEKYSKKQIFVSLLASSLVPIAPVGVKDDRYYSKFVEEHANFSEFSEQNTAMFALVQCVLFRDIDKPGSDRPNILGGVSFDFDYAHFGKKDFPNYERILSDILKNMDSIRREDIKEMLCSVEIFKTQISGESGKNILQKDTDISGYKIIPIEQIQEVLLTRIEELKLILSKYILNS